MCALCETGRCERHDMPWFNDPFYMEADEAAQERLDMQISAPDFVREGGGVK